MYATRVSSKKIGYYNLTDKNHISYSTVVPARLYKALGLWSEEDVVPHGLGQELKNTNNSYAVPISGWKGNLWSYPGIKEDWEGNPLDLHIYALNSDDISNGPFIIWEPYLEFLYRRNFLTNYYKPDALHSMSYVDGQMSHLSHLAPMGTMASSFFEGYIFHQSMK